MEKERGRNRNEINHLFLLYRIPIIYDKTLGLLWMNCEFYVHIVN